MGAWQAQALAPYAACGEGRNHTVEGKRQRNYRVDRGGGWDYRLRAAQAEGVSSASR
jgi:hypothetical protein